MRYAISDRRLAISEKGFSLLEIIMVLTLIAIMVNVAMVRFGRSKVGLEVRSAADIVASAMRRAHRKAITEGQEYDSVGGGYCLVFYFAICDVGNKRVWVQKVVTSSYPGCVPSSYSTKNAYPGTEKVLPRAISVVPTGSESGSSGTIYYYTFSSNGTVNVGANPVLTLSDSDGITFAHIFVSSSTGLVTVQWKEEEE